MKKRLSAAGAQSCFVEESLRVSHAPGRFIVRDGHPLHFVGYSTAPSLSMQIQGAAKV